jgi:sugar phosphate isomerase/epimerase
VLRELGRRVRLLHIKDGPAVHGLPMTAVGDGCLGIEDILKAAPQVEGWIVELDECATDMMQAVERSYRFLEAVRRR